MPTRSSKNWKAKKPGGWDVLNLKVIFTHSNPYGIPEMVIPTATPPDILIPFGEPAKGNKTGCHFFLDDYRFERIWNRPTVYIERLKSFDVVFTPDFSIYAEWPQAINIWQTYRNRWLGCFWQSKGINVIPTIGWAETPSFDYCFLGVPKGSPVAIATPRIRSELIRKRFIAGLQEMICRLSPSFVLVYGKEIPLYRNECPGTDFIFRGGYRERFKKVTPALRIPANNKTKGKKT